MNKIKQHIIEHAFRNDKVSQTIGAQTTVLLDNELQNDTLTCLQRHVTHSFRLSNRFLDLMDKLYNDSNDEIPIQCNDFKFVIDYSNTYYNALNNFITSVQFQRRISKNSNNTVIVIQPDRQLTDTHIRLEFYC